MNAPQTALRNRRIIWGNRAADPLGGQLPGSIPADSDRSADRRDAGDHHCVCSDGCSGVTDRETCNGHPDADGGAHGAAALDLGSSAFNPSTITYLANCDCGDEDRNARAAARA